MVGFGRSIITVFSLLRPSGSVILGPQACVNFVPSVHAGEQPHHFREETRPATFPLLLHHHAALLQRGARPPLGAALWWPAWLVVPSDGEWAWRHLARYDHVLPLWVSVGPGAAITATLHWGTLARAHGILALLVAVVVIQVVVGARVVVVVVVHTVPGHGGAAGAAVSLPPDGDGAVAHAVATHPAEALLVATAPYKLLSVSLPRHHAS